MAMIAAAIRRFLQPFSCSCLVPAIAVLALIAGCSGSTPRLAGLSATGAQTPKARGELAQNRLAQAYEAYWQGLAQEADGDTFAASRSYRRGLALLERINPQDLDRDKDWDMYLDLSEDLCLALPEECNEGELVAKSRNGREEAGIALDVNVSIPYTLDALHDTLPAEAPARRQSFRDHWPEAEYDVPVVLNDHVRAWMRAYTGELRENFQLALTRSGRYLAMMKRIFHEEGLPEDLVYMAHVESAYKHKAVSRARARGLWQFMAGTARRYGLRINSFVDERLDPEKATRAAARHLRDLHAEFSDWYLAMAAYNAGGGKVRYAISRTRKRDFWKIASSRRYLRRETRNFVPAILAAITISKNPERFGFKPSYAPELLYDKAIIDSPTDLLVIARCANVGLEKIQDLNSALNMRQTPPEYAAYEIRLPVGTGERFADAFARIPRDERILYTRHKVSRGETLSSIALKYNTHIAAIQDANRMGRRTLIRAGSELLIPSAHARFYESLLADGGPGQGAESGRSAGSAGSGGSSGREVYDPRRAWLHGSSSDYTVRGGDCLYLIGRRFGVTVRQLQEWNGLGGSTTIYRGQKLRVRAPHGWGAAGGDASGHGGESSAGLNEVIHVVRKGECLSAIARRYGTTVHSLCAWNSVNPRQTIYPGWKLKVYVDGDHYR